MKKKIGFVAIAILALTTTITTFAFLTAQTDPLTNTFTVGDLNITLTETYVQDSKIYPGVVISKTPVVTVKANSEPSHVYVSIDNQLAPSGVLNIDTSKWIKVGDNGSTKSIYRYYQVIPLSATDLALTVFSTVSFSDELTSVTGLADKDILIDAFAHQSLATTESVATAAALAHFGVTAN